MHEHARANTMTRPCVRGGLALLIALAVCLGLLPKAAWAADGDSVTVKPEVYASSAYVNCTQDTIIDVSDLTYYTRLYVNANVEGCTITLKGDAGKTYPIEVTFGYYQGKNNKVGRLPEKVVFDGFRTSEEVYAPFYDSDGTDQTVGEDDVLVIEYSGTSGAKSIQAGNNNNIDEKLGPSLELRPASEGSTLFVDDSIRSNTNLTISGGTVLSGGNVQAGEVAAGKKLTIANCVVTMKDGADREISGNVVDIDNSTLNNVLTMCTFNIFSGFEEASTMDNSSIEITSSTVTMQRGSDEMLNNRTTGIVNAKTITIEKSKVSYVGECADVCLGGLFVELKVTESEITGAATADDNHPAIGVDMWSWNGWSGKAGQTPKITIDNSTVSAQSGAYGPALGCGRWGGSITYPPVSIEIKNGSAVTAVAQNGAGIGSGNNSNQQATFGAISVTIEDSTVKASSVNGAGIGSGFTKCETDTPTNITVSGTSDVTAVSQNGAGIGAGHRDNTPASGIPVQFEAGVSGWRDEADQSGDAKSETLDSARGASSRLNLLSANDEYGLGENSGTLTLSTDANGKTPVVKAESGVKAVSLAVKASAPMMEYTLADEDDVPGVTTPINRAAEGAEDDGPGAPSYDLRPGFRSLAFWPVDAGTYSLSYGSGDDPDPLLDATLDAAAGDVPTYSATYTLATPSADGDALTSFSVVRQCKLGGNVTLEDGSGAPVEGAAVTGTTLSLDLTGITPADVLTGDASKSLTYQWYRDGVAIADATASTYTATEVGVYRCVVTGTGLYRGSVSSQAATVAADVEAVPAAPTVSNLATQITATSITLDTAGTGYQYSIDGGATWQESPVFSNLARNTEYSFVQLAGEDGPTSAAASFSTKPGAPAASDLVIDYKNETFSLASGVSAYEDEACQTKLAAGDPNSSISDYIGKKVYLKYDDVDVNGNADDVVTAVEVADRPAAPTLKADMVSASDTSLSFVGESGVTYSLFSESDTVKPTNTQVGDGSTITFTGLSASTTYVIKARKEASETSFHSYQARLEVATSATLVRMGITPTRTEYPYTGFAQPFEFTTVPADITGFTVTYYWIEDGSFTQETGDAPVNVGAYKVRVVRAADATYAAVDMTFDMEIVAGEQTAPAPPEAEAVTSSSITLKAPQGSDGKTVEYAYVMGANASAERLDEDDWKSGVEFTGLQPGTAYTFFARYAASGNYAASPASAGATIYTASAAPAQNTGFTLDYAAETATAAVGFEVSMDGVTWSAGPIGVTPGETLHVRAKATEAGAPASEATANTLAARPVAPVGVTGGYREMSGLADTMEYSQDGTTWTKIDAADLDQGVLSGLAAGTYLVRYQASATGDAFASESVEVRVTGPSSSGTTTYPVAVEEAEHGAVEVDPERPRRGQTVTITTTPDEGYLVGSVTVVAKDGSVVEVTASGDGAYAFTMPAQAVTVTVRFVCDGGVLCPSAHLVDVEAGAWYHEAVDWAVSTGLMGGYDDGSNTFGPDDTLTRAQLAQIMYNEAGNPKVGAAEAEQFADCNQGDWYAQAVVWASQTGLMTGYDDGSGRFGPNDTLTREQLAVVFWRMAGEPAGHANLDQFPDGAATNPWACDAVMWAVETELLKGYANTGELDPAGDLTRAQAATVFYRQTQEDADR